jgi:hypothetical protein
MNKETIQQIAAEVVHRLPFGEHPWLFFVADVLVMALAGALADHRKKMHSPATV